MNKADIGLIGLAVMGENLCLNMESKGFHVAVYNRSAQKVEGFIQGRAAGKNITGCTSLQQLAGSLQRPRKIMLMVKAGAPVDEFIEILLPYLEAGDIIIDGGNSNFQDTIRRAKLVEEAGMLYVGAGVSGGEEGALNGPSIMPGGSAAAWGSVKDIFRAVSAKADDGEPCCGWVGSDGAGHFVKMVHNGIEYGDMQLICEAYHIMREYLGMPTHEIHAAFKSWNEGELESYLIEITRDILAFEDTDGSPLIDKILDTAGQKGTGKWTLISSLDEGIPLTLIGEAVWARCLSAQKDERVQASKLLSGPNGDTYTKFSGDTAAKAAFVEDIRNALFASKIVSYAQGFVLLRSAANTYGWNMKPGEVAMMWRGGCIIRSAFLSNIKQAFEADPNLNNLLLDPYFKNVIGHAQGGWRRVCSAAILSGIPTPALSSALAYYDGYRCASLPSNLLQAQRDYFGAHTYERTDKPRGEFFHTNWTGKGGATSASTYTV
ncbi:MAG: decarboxylating NADP(+)-dependent phosphogluconate dehydrogenase [Defluviitaleaceae bacterium]|nr:decarboxylating NADP(+)-dependent phosphogluconate dehydrogenase [Defluviitaleaceae bacterium]